MRLRAVALSTLLFAMALSAAAQTIDLAKDRVAMTELVGPWRFQPGDDSSWSSAAIDDSSWPQLVAGKPWTEQGYPQLTGVAWYRIRVLLPAKPAPLAFFLPGVASSAQVFANGCLIGQLGGMPPHPEVILDSNRVFTIPQDCLRPGRPLLLAVRVWYWPKAQGLGGGLSSKPSIGDPQTITEWRQLRIDSNVHSNLGVFVDFYADCMTGLAGLGLFFLRRKERPYLWWGISELLWAGFLLLLFAVNFVPFRYSWYDFAHAALFSIAYCFQIEFYTTFLRQPRRWLFGGAVCSMLVAQALLFLFFANPLHPLLNYLGILIGMVSYTFIVAMLLRGVRSRAFGAGMLLFADLGSFFTWTLQAVASLPPLSKTSWGPRILLFLDQPIAWLPTSAYQITGDFLMFAVLAILVLSYARSRSDEERLSSELEAARTVQKVLIPEETPAIPGFDIQTIYHPASQVGGDFFQVIALPSGGALLTIGDVSGKGMPAAMTVSLLVGTFRTLAHYTQSPGEILHAMNQRMLSRSGDGFTTCLVLRVDPDGALTAASAGHLAPYIDGHELALENGLPLGLSPDSRYEESTVQLQPGQQLTLLTDGVPEARNAEGALFGFDRAASIATQSAETIAEAARNFGQEDDVTVIKLALAPTPVAA
ncbi:MAG TPA: SpoIIE family protein phosphatase [Bryocella sp.]|nr:SpoIIE family protein phosphatase [Bryocella sp.]